MVGLSEGPDPQIFFEAAAVSFQNRVALVTGAAHGIGREIALVLGRAGVRVAVSYRTNKLGAQKVLNELKTARGLAAGPPDLAVATDVTDWRRAKELLDAVVRHFGRLDILVNNVGDFEWKAVIDSTIAEWHSVLASNLFSVFYTSKYALPTMRAQRWGRIINIGSVGAERPLGRPRSPPTPLPSPAWSRLAARSPSKKHAMASP